MATCTEYAPVTTERFTSVDRDQREVVTAAAEKIGLPLNHTFPFILGDDGHLWSETGERFIDIQKNGLRDIAHKLDEEPWQIEHDRRISDRETMMLLEAFARGELGNGAMAWLMETPDLVREKRVHIGGEYDYDRLPIMGGVAIRTPQGLLINSLSLDAADKDGYYGDEPLRAVAARLGKPLPNRRMSSEEKKRHCIFKLDEEFESPQELTNIIRDTYDTWLLEVRKVERFAGAEPKNYDNALGFILQQEDLIEQTLQKVRGFSPKHPLRKQAEYDFAAALRIRLRGGEVQDTAVAGQIGRDSGWEFSGGCPVADAQEQLEKTGLGKKRPICPYCDCDILSIDPTFDICAKVVQCPNTKECGALMVEGVVIDRGKKFEAAQKAELKKHSLGKEMGNLLFRVIFGLRQASGGPAKSE
ncbi:MAG TPA: hypothetical protein VFT87_05230 [Candidatus Saccharimonadales bacterium]|nr:hypothetical protein [Candidatus Saccharimonadales bacterium]